VNIMRVQDIMTGAVETTTPDATADEAWGIMKREGIHHLVVKDGSRLVGLLSSRDLGGARGGGARAGRQVADLMTPGVVTVAPTETVRKAANLMRGRTLGSLVVSDKGRLVGMITVADLLDVLGHGGGRASVRRHTLSHRAPHRKRHVSAGPW
jgi:acetoin utilization protein AcuB